MRASVLSAILALTSHAAIALAVPVAGARVAAVKLVDSNDRERLIPSGPEGRVAQLVLYQDKDASGQNARAEVLIGRYTDRKDNADKLEFLATADVSQYAWWPARRYALSDIRKTASKEGLAVVIDWKGAARIAWGLTRGKSAIVLFARDGHVLFAAEGTLDDAQIARLDTELGATGARKLEDSSP